ncbi:pantoate--beta-alanine ligase [Chitinophagaceae bacterium IBVUCB1]|nr:pantoate--beta-alanine ligase [Chitinophagaceae bacterium IBVUCB1]
MVIFKKVAYIQQYISAQRVGGRQVGFVPTMGALHDGHISLVGQAKQAADMVVSSIFVNPTQFNDKADFEKYPISVEADVAMLIDAGCDVLLLPSVDEMYPNGTADMPVFDFGYLDTVLEGAKRPGHFKGVGQIVARLLDIVKPDKLFMGQKDYQQCMVVKNLLQQLGSNTDMIICPTQREPDGLAMSSRNRRLTTPQRALAGVIYQCLVSIKTKQTEGNFALVHKECADLMAAKGFEVEYISLADADDLTILDNYNANRPMVALIAAKLGDIRLIDNMLLQ